jgi:FtsH-binding integral membrane protein
MQPTYAPSIYNNHCPIFIFTINDTLPVRFHVSARVYAILAGQLLVTALSCVAFGIHPTLANAMVPGSAMAAVPWVSLAVSSIAWFCMCLNPDYRRKAPMKWKLLFLFTAGEAISVGFLSSFYKFQSVVLAMGTTALAAVTVSAYTILNTNAKYDLSQWGQGLSS